jgi:OOP family OmpA-OmpF porin
MSALASHKRGIPADPAPGDDRGAFIKGGQHMNRIRTIAVTLLVLSGLLAAPQAMGQFYLGGSFGKSDFDNGNAIPDLITSGSVDGSDSGLKIFGGYQFNKNLALELSYVDLGKASYSGTFFGAPVTGGSVDTTGLNFSVVGILPLNPSFELFGKVGLFAWEAQARDTTGGVPFSGKDDGADLSVGIGASYNISKNFSVRAEWEQFKAVDTISLLSLGIVFKF